MSPEIAELLRAETPAAPRELRERVALVAAMSPPPSRTFPVRRVLVLAAPVALAASFAVALAVGIESATTNRIGDESAGGTAAPTAPLERAQRREASDTDAGSSTFQQPARLKAGAAPAPAVIPGTTRAKDVQANLTVLVDNADDLSATTQRALRATRRLGGYVLTVQYGTPEPTEGTATLRVRIPVSRVQAAIVQFSDLGRILAQQVQISDLQQPLDELTRRIRRLERRAANAQGAERARIQAEIAALRRQRTEINRRAAFATVDLGLTTHEPEKEQAPPSRFDRAIDDATGVLSAELAIAAYALIVASPILVLLAAAFAASRTYRRYADQRLLERA